MALEKILKNTTGSTIELDILGLDIAASSQVEIDNSYFKLLSSDDSIAELTTHINAGDIVVNDGTTDLSATEAVRWLEWPDRIDIEQNDSKVTRVNKILNFEGPGLSVVNEGDGKTTVSSTQTAVGSLISYVFEANGNVSNKWLGYTNSAKSSEIIPLVIPQDSEIKGFTFSNADDDVDIDAELYVNGTLAFTWEIRNKRTAFLSGVVSPPTALQGDRVSLFLRKYSQGSGDNTAQDPTVAVIAKIVTEQIAEGGTQFGV